MQGYQGLATLRVSGVGVRCRGSGFRDRTTAQTKRSRAWIETPQRELKRWDSGLRPAKGTSAAKHSRCLSRVEKSQDLGIGVEGLGLGRHRGMDVER